MGQYLDLSDLAKDVEKYATNILKFTAGDVADEMTFTAYDAIEKFYDDYPDPSTGFDEPPFYKRHYTNFIKRSFKRFTHNNRNRVYSGGVELSTDDMYDYYHGTLDQVFTSVYMGFHGLPMENTPIMVISPYEMIFLKQIQIYQNPAKYISSGIKKANSEKYSNL